MKIGRTIAASFVAMAAIGGTAANAGVVLSDNFNSDVATLNWTGDSTFTSISPTGNAPNPASVDLVGNGDGFGNLAYNGSSGGISLDLDGTTGSGNAPTAGEIQSNVSLAKGNYTVSFLLAGNLRTSTEQTTVVSVGDQTVDISPANYLTPYTQYNLSFKGASGAVSFSDLGPSDQQGNLLDNVVVTAVPEPAAWAMLLLGFFGIGFMVRSTGKKDAAAVA